ncbi:MAG TPA: hypothetical protein VHR72_15295 [Gemmataceae bacterium]|jgi:hypothetical protein|nr:hypothetical protein [Gemmataceae bacterium]
MSQIIGRVGVPNPFLFSPTPRVGPEPELTPEMREALVVRAKDVIAHRMPGPTVAIPQSVQDFFAQQIKTFPAEPDPKVMKEMAEEASLQEICQGELVAVIRDMNDDLTVLAVGTREVDVVLDSLTDHERSKILVRGTY